MAITAGSGHGTMRHGRRCHHRVVIRRPVAEVAAYAGDPTNAPRWYTNIRTVEVKTPPPLAQGSQIGFVATFLGRTLSYTYEVVELVAGERLTMRTAEGPFPMVTTYTWTSLAPDETRTTLRNTGTSAGSRRSQPR